MKRALMVAFHFPPFAGSSGDQRTLRFVQHLPRLGWQPLVLSVRPMAYEQTRNDLLADVTLVQRAWALDSSRHLALGGRYLAATARPDRWGNWQFDAVHQGMKLIERYRPQVIWFTYPIATAHLIGAELSRRIGLPWVADFRDPMAQEGYPAAPVTWQQFKAIENTVFAQAAYANFITPGTLTCYQDAYLQAAQRMGVLANGYDEESFASFEGGSANRQPLFNDRLCLLHSGVIYLEDRDPRALFAALAQLKAQTNLPSFTLRFRASGQDRLLAQLAKIHQVEDLIEISPALPYREALGEMMRADALLILQAGNCNAQIPAKIYEYFRARRSIICLTDPACDTSLLLGEAGFDWLAPIDDAAVIVDCLRRAIMGLHDGQVPLATPAFIAALLRAQRSQDLANIFESCAYSEALVHA